MANHCVRSGLGVNGDGSTWGLAASPGAAGAFNEIPNTLVRGDDYYLADGTYLTRVFDDAVSTTLMIGIKKATTASHGIATGWDDSYGDGQAIFTGAWVLRTSYMNFDGAWGSMVDSDTGYGFQIDRRILAGTNINCVYAVNYAPSHINIYNTDMCPGGEDRLESSDDGIYCIQLVGAHSTDWLIQDCRVHHTNRTGVYLTYVERFYFNRCIIRSRHTDGTVHGELFSLNHISDVKVYNSLVFDSMGTCMVAFLEDSDGATFYNSIFYQSSVAYDTTNGMIGQGSGKVIHNVVVNGCTFLNGYATDDDLDQAAINWTTSPSTGNTSRNNIAYNTGGIVGCASADYDAFNSSAQAAGEAHGQNLTSNPFVNIATFNLHLTSGTDDGETLASPFDVDMDGVARGTGNWDRGAYEYAGGGGGGGTKHKCTPSIFRMLNILGGDQR
jgi:hypothetical protein